MRNYKEAIKYHEKAIELRVNENKIVINYIRLAGAMIFDILYHPQDMELRYKEVLEYLEKSIEIIIERGEFGELRAWNETFCQAKDFIFVRRMKGKEEFNRKIEELSTKFQIINSRIYLLDINF